MINRLKPLPAPAVFVGVSIRQLFPAFAAGAGKSGVRRDHATLAVQTN